jgi:hypothetical protein
MEITIEQIFLAPIHFLFILHSLIPMVIVFMTTQHKLILYRPGLFRVVAVVLSILHPLTKAISSKIIAAEKIMATIFTTIIFTDKTIDMDRGSKKIL